MQYVLRNEYEEFMLDDTKAANNIQPTDTHDVRACTILSAKQYCEMQISALRESHFKLNFGTFVEGETVHLLKINQLWMIGNQNKIRMHLRLISSKFSQNSITPIPFYPN